MYSFGNFLTREGRHSAGLVLGGASQEVVVLEDQRIEPLLPTWHDDRARWESLAESGPRTALSELQVLAPVRPGTLFQSAANYRKHVVDLVVASRRATASEAELEHIRQQAEESMDQRARSGTPFVFLGRPASMCGPYDKVTLPAEGEHDWELELGVVIGRKAWHVSATEALDYVAGYVTCNDITTRDLISRPDAGALGADWFRAKNAPTFFPTGPWLVPAWYVPEPGELQIRLLHNGDVMQDESTADMIFTVPRLIEFISTTVPLEPGDLILTGSPAGNGVHWGRRLAPGDVIEGEIRGPGLETGPGFGIQRNVCVAAATD